MNIILAEPKDSDHAKPDVIYIPCGSIHYHNLKDSNANDHLKSHSIYYAHSSAHAKSWKKNPESRNFSHPALGMPYVHLQKSFRTYLKYAILDIHFTSTHGTAATHASQDSQCIWAEGDHTLLKLNDRTTQLTTQVNESTTILIEWKPAATPQRTATETTVQKLCYPRIHPIYTAVSWEIASTTGYSQRINDCLDAHVLLVYSFTICAAVLIRKPFQSRRCGTPRRALMSE